MVDVLIVGAGISAATLAAIFRDQRLSVCIVDSRSHIGGNCYDYRSSGSHIHQYGPHIFHSTSDKVTAFVSRFTHWNEIEWTVSAEIKYKGKILKVPFPFSRLTEDAIGAKLTEQQVIDLFFRGYSQKMWGMGWDDLPQSVKGRVPKDTAEKPEYFPGQFVGIPKHGYTNMIENMIDGAEVMLSVGPHEWKDIAAKRVVYTGRLDHLLSPQGASYGELLGDTQFRSLDIKFAIEDWDIKQHCKNFCHADVPYTRKVRYQFTGGTSKVISTETPKQATYADPTPYYPIPTTANLDRHDALKERVLADNQMFLCGRLATYKYLDMYQAVGQAMGVAQAVLQSLSGG